MKKRREMMNSQKGHFIIFISLVFSVLLTAPSAVFSKVENDAYAYEDDFENSLGLDMTASPGFRVFDGRLESYAADVTAVSKCFSLPQPEGSIFQEWSCLKFHIEDTGGDNTLAIRACNGNILKAVNNLVKGENLIDLSSIDPEVTNIRLEWSTSGIGAKADSWGVYGKAYGATAIDVIADAKTPKAGDTITFTIQMTSSGAVTHEPVLRFSLDYINEFLAEDGEYRPLEFVSASNGPKEVPLPGVTSGMVRWELNDMTDGFSGNVTVTLKIPIGYINGKTLAARAVLEHGVSDNRMTVEATSGSSTVVSQCGQYQKIYYHYIDIAPGAKDISHLYFVRNDLPPDTNNSDAEDVTFTITGIGSCMPLFKSIKVSKRASLYPFQVLNEHEQGEVDGDWIRFNLKNPGNTLIVHFDRIDFYFSSTVVGVDFDVPDGCELENTIGTQSQVIVGGNPECTELLNNNLDKMEHTLREKTCRLGNTWVHRSMSGNELGNNYVWPGFFDHFIDQGSLKAGEFFTAWAPYGNGDNRRQTVSLDHSYVLLEIPAGITFHGCSFSGWMTRLYKDCTGAAPAPTDAAFDHNADPPHPGWKPVNKPNDNYEWSDPFSKPHNENVPDAVVIPGCRLLGVKDNDNPPWMGPDYGTWHPRFLWRVCNGDYGCAELPEGTGMSLVGGTIYTYEAGTIRKCISYNGWTLYKEVKSWPKLYAWPEQDQVSAGQLARIILNPENDNHASQYVNGRWVTNLYHVRDYVDLEHVTGEVLIGDEFNIPKPDQNVMGESCDNIANAIKFHFPDPEGCMNAASANDAACMAWWEVPSACQPPNGWGRESGDHAHDDYMPMYRFRLNAPILKTTPANTVLNFVGECRTNDLSAVGADNAVDPARWPVSNCSAVASVTVLETPGLDIVKTGPVNRKKGDLFTYNLELENIGNTPTNGWYIGDWLPKQGVNLSDFTPQYRKIYIDRPAADVIAEYSTDDQCFADPLGFAWTKMSLGFKATDRTGFQAETVYNINAEARCIRLRKNPDSPWDFNPGDKILSAIDFQIPEDTPEGLRIFNRALAGASSTFGATSDTSSVETVNVCTEVNDAVFVEVEKTYKRHPKGVEWTITVENRSGAVAKNITVTDDLPDRPDVSYGGVVEGSLPDGWTVIEEPDIGDSGGQLKIIIDQLSPDDGNPGSGFDEGAFSVVSTLDNPFGITNCVTVEPEGGMGSKSNDCITVEKGDTIGFKNQIAMDRASGTDETRLFPGDEFSYVITATNDSLASQGIFLKITDNLDENLDYVGNTLTVNGGAASDTFFSNGALDYAYPVSLNPDETLTLKFKVKVKSTAPHGYLIENRALIMSCTDPDDPLACYLPRETPVVYARVVDTRCDFNLRVRANRVQVQPTWTDNGTAPYDLYRSVSDDTGFRRIATIEDEDIQWVMATYLDRDVQTGYTYYYYVVNSNGCRSEVTSITPRLISNSPEFVNLFEYLQNSGTTDDQDADNPNSGNDNPGTTDDQDTDYPDGGSDNPTATNDTNNVSGVNYTPMPPEPDPSPVPVPIYRLYSPTFNRHHYCDEVEKNYLLANYAEEIWTLETGAFYAYRNSENGTAPVYRLYNEPLREHLFTTDANEKDTLVSTDESSWRYEGVAFYVDPDPADGTVPVWRLYSDDLQTHLLTTDVNEKERLLAAPGWHDEGVAYYAYAAE